MITFSPLLRTLALCALLPAFTLAAQSREKPNVIFILCDDLGYGDIGAFYQNARRKNTPPGTPVIDTPSLDKLAASGVMLEGMYASAPVCAPSRASLLTGVHQGNAVIRDNRFDHALEDNHTLASVLRTAGYQTAAIGKWGLQGSATGKAGGEDDPVGVGSPQTWPAYPTKRGFDSFFGYVRHRDGHEHYPKEGLDRGRTQVWDNDREISEQADNCYTTDLFTARAKQWIVDAVRERPSRPFFLYLAYDTPHAATRLPAAPYPKGRGLNGGLQWRGTPGALINTAHGKPDSYHYPQYENATYVPSEHTLNRAEKKPLPWPDVCKRYASSVTRIDDCVGDIIQLLKDLGIEDDTVVIFTTDNGPSDESYLTSGLYAPDFFRSYGPFSGIKRDCLEGGVRVGAIVHGPGLVKSGHATSRPSQFHDWMPTLAQLAGIPAPARTDGVSLLPDLRGDTSREDSVIYFEYQGPGKTPGYASFPADHRGRLRGQMQAVRLGDLVGVRYDTKNADTPFEVYDVVQDPGQRHDLAKKSPEQQRRLKDAAARLHKVDTFTKRPYDSALIPGVSPAVVKPGLRWSSHRIDAPYLPKFDGMTPVADGIGEDIAACLKAVGDNGAYLQGLLFAPEDGDYVFSAEADTSLFVRLHGVALLDGDRGPKTQGMVREEIRLKAGYHPIRIYTRGGGDPRLLWHKKGEAPAPVAAKHLFHTP